MGCPRPVESEERGGWRLIFSSAVTSWKSGVTAVAVVCTASTAVAQQTITLADATARALERNTEPVAYYDGFRSTLERDVRDTLACIDLVLAQPALSSQLIDNLNASIHLRALLTDLFLLGEVLRMRVKLTVAVEEQ